MQKIKELLESLAELAKGSEDCDTIEEWCEGSIREGPDYVKRFGRALSAALPELRELVKLSRGGRRIGDSLPPVRAVVPLPGDVLRHLRDEPVGPFLVLGPHPRFGPNYIEVRRLSEPVVDMGINRWDHDLVVIATGVPLDTTRWPMEEK